MYAFLVIYKHTNSLFLSFYILVAIFVTSATYGTKNFTSFRFNAFLQSLMFKLINVKKRL